MPVAQVWDDTQDGERCHPRKEGVPARVGNIRRPGPAAELGGWLRRGRGEVRGLGHPDDKEALAVRGGLSWEQREGSGERGGPRWSA